MISIVAVAAGQTACLGTRMPAGSAPGPEHATPIQSSTLDSLRLQGPAARAAVDKPIGPGDLIDVQVFDAPELSRVVRVSDAGEISLPLLGVILAAGQTVRAFEVEIQEKLRGSYMLDPRVTIEVKETAAQPIYVLGEVNQPGAFTATGGGALTVLRAVAVARGLKPTASRRRAVIIRARAEGEPLQIPVNLGDIVNGKTPDLVLHPSDVVYVQKNSERAVALGVIDALLRAVTFRAVF